jgi:hypothetical protein
MNRKALIALRDAVKAGRWWDDVGIAGSALRKAGIDGVLASVTTRAFHGSFDAAKALHEAVLRGWNARIFLNGYAVVEHPKLRARDKDAHVSDNPARAWLLAILEALIAETPE